MTEDTKNNLTFSEYSDAQIIKNEQKEETAESVPQDKTPATETPAANPNERNANVFESIYAALNLVCIVTILLATIFGMASLFSNSATPLFVINSALALFNITRGNIYRTLASAAMSAVYVVFLVVAIKNLVLVIKLCVKIFGKSLPQDKWNKLYYAFCAVKDSAYKSVLFIVLCYLLSGDALTVGSYFIFVMFFIDYVLTASLLFIQRNKAQFFTKKVILEFVFFLLRTAFMIACVCLIAQYLIQPSGLNLSFGVPALIRSSSWSARIIHNLFELIVKPVLDIVLTFIFLAIASALFSDAGYAPSQRPSTNSEVKTLSRQVLIIAAISAAVTCILIIVNGYNVQFSASLLGNLFFALRSQYLPVILLTVMLLVFSTIPLDGDVSAPQPKPAAAK